MTLLPRHVVIDLLPLYLADEVSVATRDAIEAYLHSDAKLATEVRELGGDSRLAVHQMRMDIDPVIGVIQRTRALLALQRWLFALGIGFTAIGLSVTASIANGRVERAHWMLRDFPVACGICLAAAAACWTGYARLRARLR